MPITVTHINRSLPCILTLLFLLSFLIGNSQANSIPDKTISIYVKNQPLSQVLKKLSKNTGVAIYFHNEEISLYNNISLNEKNTSFLKILNSLLDKYGLTWIEVDQSAITIRKKQIELVHKASLTDTTISVTGKIVNEKGEPVAGATIQIRGGQKGTTTGPDGNFFLKEVRLTSTLIISNVGYLTREVSLHGKAVIGQIILDKYVDVLDETQVIAYGETSRRLNVGNVVTIKSTDIEKQPVSNPLYALQGRVAGLRINPTSGLAGAPVTLQIRGNNSLRFQTEPLIVIDGLPIINNITGLGHAGYRDNKFSALNFINPNDISSIEILKDADATSIYGSRGANGVILITTKKGKDGDTHININIQSGFSHVAKKVDILNTLQYLELRYEAFSNSGRDVSTLNPSLSNVDVTHWDKGRYTDWQKTLIGNQASYNDITASVGGGNSLIKYIVGGTFHRETTVFPGNNSDEKGSAYMTLTGTSPNQKIKASANVSYLVDKNTLPGLDLTNQAITLAPNAPLLYTENGNLNYEPFQSGAKSWDNPIYNIAKAYSAKVKNFNANIALGYQVFPNLTVKAQFGYNNLAGSALKFSNPFKGRHTADLSVPGVSYFNTNGITNLSFEPQATYNIRIGKGSLQTLVGASYQTTISESQQIIANGYTSDALMKNLTAATSFLQVANASSEYKYAAIFGRVNYTWDRKYILNITARRDGSSRFGPGKQFGNFGSVGAAWLFSEEPLLKLEVPYLSFGKIRFSYGTSGNDAVGDYQYLERYQPANELYQGSKGYLSSGLFNSYYAWEVTRKIEMGFELGFFKDRIFLSASYFRNRSDNQLISFPFPSMAGPGSPLFNLPALIQNTGIELTASIQNVKSAQFSWSTSINLTINRNKLLKYPNVENSPFINAAIGQPFTGTQQVFNAAGVEPTTGMYQFTDVSGHLTYTPEEVTRADGGRYIRIMVDPKFYGGITNTLVYKGVSLDFLFQFAKQTGINPLQSFLPTAGSKGNLPVDFLERWRKSGDAASIQKIYSTRPAEYTTAANRQQNSNFSYVDASFIRLKNVSLSYSFSHGLMEKIRFENLRVFVNGQNLWTITKYKGLDPETQSMTSLPPLRVIVFGINATF